MKKIYSAPECHLSFYPVETSFLSGSGENIPEKGDEWDDVDARIRYSSGSYNSNGNTYSNNSGSNNSTGKRWGSLW